MERPITIFGSPINGRNDNWVLASYKSEMSGAMVSLHIKKKANPPSDNGISTDRSKVFWGVQQVFHPSDQ